MKAKQTQVSSKQSPLSMEDGDEKRISDRRSVLLEVLKARMNEPTSWVGYIVQTAALFSLLNVGLYKFALDANSTPSLRSALSWMGIAVSIGGFFACILMENLRRNNRKNQEQLFKELEVSINVDQLGAVKYATICAALGVAVNFAAWIYILVTTPK